jgi:hypothetical protein
VILNGSPIASQRCSVNGGPSPIYMLPQVPPPKAWRREVSTRRAESLRQVSRSPVRIRLEDPRQTPGNT